MTEPKIPNPETRLSVIKRYLHVLALLQNNKDPKDWNASSLAELLSLDEVRNEGLSDKNIRDYIKKYLIDEMGFEISTTKGSRRTELCESLEEEILKRIAAVYTSFIAKDSSREIILSKLIKKHPYECLWMLARIYFASVQKKKIQFDYIVNQSRSRSPHTFTVHPYRLVFRNNNLYLVAKSEYNGKTILIIVNKIENLKVTEDSFDEDGPSLEELFQYSLGSFIGEKYRVRLRIENSAMNSLEEILSILEPEYRECSDGNGSEAIFNVSDEEFLCKQLFPYGRRVEILEPKEMRETMTRLLRESLAVYEKG